MTSSEALRGAGEKEEMVYLAASRTWRRPVPSLKDVTMLRTVVPGEVWCWKVWNAGMWRENAGVGTMSVSSHPRSSWPIGHGTNGDHEPFARRY